MHGVSSVQSVLYVLFVKEVLTQSHFTLTGRLCPSHTLLFFSFECGEQLLVCGGVKAQAVTLRRHPAPSPCAVTLRLFVGDVTRAHTQGSSPLERREDGRAPRRSMVKVPPS